MSITNETINDIESYINEDLTILEKTSYKAVNVFKLRPGHKAFLLQLPNQIKSMRESRNTECLRTKIQNFPQMLKTFIETAETNFERRPNGFRYDDINRDFSAFIYLLCGKACYEMLSSNLPMPTYHTIRKTIRETFLNWHLSCILTE